FWFRHAIILGKSRTSRTNSCMASPFCSLLLRHVRPARFNCIMTVCESPAVLSPGDAARLETLDAVQRRVLWLAVSQVHHANRVRRTESGVKVGGHQASSASMVSIMSALYFSHLRASDRVSVKPHAAPVLHAVNYLLGRLDR